MPWYAAREKARLESKCTATAMKFEKAMAHSSGLEMVWRRRFGSSFALGVSLARSKRLSRSASGRSSSRSTNLPCLIARTRWGGIGASPDRGRVRLLSPWGWVSAFAAGGGAGAGGSCPVDPEVVVPGSHAGTLGGTPDKKPA